MSVRRRVVWSAGLALCLPLGARAGLFDPPEKSADKKAAPPNVPEQSPAQVQSQVQQYLSGYKLGAGDVITIRVFGEDDLSREKIRLTDTGTLFMPGVGEVVARDRTLGDLERLVTERLRGRILVNPQVSVFLEEYRPFFINGMVDKPGGYPYQAGLNVRKAASLAGGFKERASLNKIFIVRSADATQTPVKADLATLVFPGDTVIVEESFF